MSARRRLASLVAAATLATVAAGCAGGDQRIEDTTAPAAPAAGAVGASGSVAAIPPAASFDTAAPCRPTGAWSVCHVVKRLEATGLVPRVDSATVTEEGIPGAGTQVHVGRGELELYVFADSVARKRVDAGLRRAAYTPADAMIGMRGEPTLILSANLIAILHSRNDHLRERVTNALVAGPPQPTAP